MQPRFVYLDEDHPYLEGMEISVTGKLVRWRDFHTVKQEAGFQTEKEARQFAFRLKASAMVIDMDQIGGCADEAMAYWEAKRKTSDSA